MTLNFLIDLLCLFSFTLSLLASMMAFIHRDYLWLTLMLICVFVNFVSFVTLLGK